MRIRTRGGFFRITLQNRILQGREMPKSCKKILRQLSTTYEISIIYAYYPLFMHIIHYLCILSITHLSPIKPLRPLVIPSMVLEKLLLIRRLYAKRPKTVRILIILFKNSKYPYDAHAREGLIVYGLRSFLEITP